jgi:hypothetical protein
VNIVGVLYTIYSDPGKLLWTRYDNFRVSIVVIKAPDTIIADVQDPRSLGALSTVLGKIHLFTKLVFVMFDSSIQYLFILTMVTSLR